MAGPRAFDDYDARFQRQLDERLRLLELDPTSLASKPVDTEDIDLSSPRPLATGLGIAIRRVHAVEARISRYGFDEKAGTWDCLLHDRFGLDLTDVAGLSRSLKGRSEPSWNGFLAWYILQHHRGCGRFVVEANITRRKRPSEPGRPARRERRAPRPGSSDRPPSCGDSGTSARGRARRSRVPAPSAWRDGAFGYGPP